MIMKRRKSLFHVTESVVQWNTPVCQPLLGGFHMLAYMLNPPCPGFLLGSWLSNANSKERSKKKIPFFAMVSINGSALVQEVEVVSVSGLQFFAKVSPMFMSCCYNALAFYPLQCSIQGHWPWWRNQGGTWGSPRQAIYWAFAHLMQKGIKNWLVWASSQWCADPAQGAQAGMLMLCCSSPPRELWSFWKVSQARSDLLMNFALWAGEAACQEKNLPWRLQ